MKVTVSRRRSLCWWRAGCGRACRRPSVADAADVTGLSSGFTDALRHHGSGARLMIRAGDVAVLLAELGRAIADLAVLRNQSALFGPVASDATAWRVLDRYRRRRRPGCGPPARRHESWPGKTMETRGGLPTSTAAGQPILGLVLDLGATIVICHSEKESATRT